MHRPNARRATRHAAVAAAALLALATLHPLPGLAQPAGQPLATELADALSQPPMAVGDTVSVALSRGQSAFIRLPEGAGELVAETRRLSRNADTVMALIDSQGRLLDEDDDGGEENLASRIEIGADQRGPLFLRVGLLDDRPARFDVVLTPALAFEAPRVGEFWGLGAAGDYQLQCEWAPQTSMVNVVGVPAIAVPTHLTDEGLAMGVQLIGRPGSEAQLLQLAEQLTHS